MRGVRKQFEPRCIDTKRSAVAWKQASRHAMRQGQKVALVVPEMGSDETKPLASKALLTRGITEASQAPQTWTLPGFEGQALRGFCDGQARIWQVLATCVEWSGKRVLHPSASGRDYSAAI